jgi:alcohol dehydrogenase
MKTYKAYITEEIEKNKFQSSITQLNLSDLKVNDTLVEVHYSSLNYKDALSAGGHYGITRKYPHTPGVDAAGIVVDSISKVFKPGDEVIITGYDLGMNTYGGFGQYISVPSEWLVRKPDNLSLKESMMFGTAGFTAGICIYEFLKHEITPDKGKILVTGATGGVGILSVAILAKLGYEVTASTGKLEYSGLLKELGATEVIHRSEVFDNSNRALLPGSWIGAIDTVGGNTLSTVIRSTKLHGCVCVLGNVESDELKTSVYPFLLRGIKLLGIDSASTEMKQRIEIWNHLASDWKIDNFDKIIKEVSLGELQPEIDLISKGGQVGHVLVNLRE